MSLAGTPRLQESRCARFRFRYSECSRCADACPHEAITLDDVGARVNPARCQDCALCVDACHTSALESASYAPIEMLRQAIKGGAWAVSCAPSGARADAVVPCLGAIGPVILAYLARRGIALRLRGNWHCAACPHGAKGVARLEANLRAVTALRDAAQHPGDGAWVLPAVDQPAPNEISKGARHVQHHGSSRRLLFRSLVTRIADPAIPGAGTAMAPREPSKAIRAGAWFVPEQRELLQIVCRRSDALPVKLPADEVLPLMELALKPGCTTCEACFRVCPTGALTIEENPEDWALTFQADRCVACGVCLEACQPRVLEAKAEVDARPDRAAVQLLGRVKQRCARCDRYFPSLSAEEYCPVCSDDQDAFSAIFG